jgi:hypothetical protein
MSPDRSMYRFRTSARQALDFLLGEGYSCTCESDVRVRYESDAVHVEMNHGIRDGEVSISFGRLNTDERFSFVLFLELTNPVIEKGMEKGGMGVWIADTPDMVATIANSLGLALQSEGKGIIKGAPDIFDRMKSVRWWHLYPEALEKPE